MASKKKAPAKKRTAADSAPAPSVTQFLAGIEPAVRRDDAQALHRLFRRVTGKAAKMWGTSIVGYGSYEYTLANGKAGKSLRIGFSPRKAQLVLYIMPGFETAPHLLELLGKHSTGKSCLYITRLAQVDAAVLEELVQNAWDEMGRRYPESS